ncbi:Coiled-coil domain-containing protein 12 [Verticillium dahliae VDG1]|nr:Coiled-coil domain-containing protein 12 [Verticillium dahliae VDG1]
MFGAPPPVFADARAQCMHCEYEHKYSQLLQDTDKESIADLQGEGIRYRRRFLYKSHMATRHMTKTSYGCPFCVHIGSTTYEGDATARWVQLEAPRRGKLAGQAPPRTQRSGVARWKWDVKAGTGPGWLGFDKGETITNLDWDDPDAWYWVGTTSKGKHGIFPTSHMKIETIKDGSLEGLTSPVKPKKRGFFGLGRRNSSAAPSEHGSGHSHKS